MKLISKALALARSMQPWAQTLVLLGLRLHIAQVFFLSGLTKIRDWDTTLLLFREEYHVPLLPPPVAAVMGAGGELVLPVLLVAGLFGRFAALGLFVVNLVAALSYPGLTEAGLQQHFYWGVLLAVLAAFGSGKIALDAWACRWLGRWASTCAAAGCAAGGGAKP